MQLNKIHAIRGNALGDYISVDIAAFINCESRQGYKYVVCFVDHATKFSWVYGMKTCDEYIEKLRHLVDVELHDVNYSSFFVMICRAMYCLSRQA